VKLVIGTQAASEIAELHVYIGARNAVAADKTVTRLLSVCRLLADAPKLGRRTRIANLRKFPVAGTRYIIVYRIDRAADELTIVSFLHSARQRRLD
jgi:plasmid stabilization system protein ParE